MSAIENLKSKKWQELTNAETVVIFYYNQYRDNDGDKVIAEQAADELAAKDAVIAAARRVIERWDGMEPGELLDGISFMDAFDELRDALAKIGG
jgi:hypothetical protein